jgi:RNA polymerase sigma factor (sigma-70 family)
MASLTRDLRHGLAVAFRRTDMDAELLTRFVAARDEAAFAEIVHRHGPAVLRVCRSLLSHADADDAFQATFFVLARRAESLTNVRSLGGWLVGVAGRVARQLRRSGWRRAVVEKAYVPHNSADSMIDQNLKELNEELTQLPNRYRDPIVLCFLQDRTQDEAAAELGQNVRTLRRRLEKAKALLRVRLVRRGVAPAVLVPITPLMISSAAVARTATAAVQFLAGEMSSPVATLAKGFGMTSLIKLKVAAGLCAVAGTLTAVGVAQDNPKPSPLTNRSAPADAHGPTPIPLSGSISHGMTSSAVGVSLVSSAGENVTLARIVLNEAQYHYKQLHSLWFESYTRDPKLKIHLTSTPGRANDGRTDLHFGIDDQLESAKVNLIGSVEWILFNQLPCEMTHVVLAEHFGQKLPKWADHGMALTAMSLEHQAGADAAIRQFLNNGKGLKLKFLFAKKDVPPQMNEDWAVFVTESASVVRFLMTRKADGLKLEHDGATTKQIPNEPGRILASFVEVGAAQEDWDGAVKAIYGFKDLAALEEQWVKWLTSDASRVGLPKLTPVLPPPPAPDPARIPPVNLGK